MQFWYFEWISKPKNTEKCKFYSMNAGNLFKNIASCTIECFANDAWNNYCSCFPAVYHSIIPYFPFPMQPKVIAFSQRNIFVSPKQIRECLNVSSFVMSRKKGVHFLSRKGAIWLERSAVCGSSIKCCLSKFPHDDLGHNPQK